MPQLGCHSEGPAHQDAVKNDTTSDAGADGKHDHVGGVNGSTETKLAPGRRVGVVLDGDGQLKGRLEAFSKRFISPRQVGGEIDG
jgi:hypothetical protein